MINLSILIGNTDQRLNLIDWSNYVKDCQLEIEKCCKEIYFFGGPENWSSFQNVCWVISLEKENELEESLILIKEKYKQNSIALIYGETKFI